MNLPDAPFFSVVICSISPPKFAQVCECYESLLADFPHEIIGIHDAQSMAEGYNRGLQRSRGDIVIFSHDDILILDPDFARKISNRLRDFDILGFSGASRVVADNWWNADYPWLFGAIANPHHGTRSIRFSLWCPEPWPVVDNIQCIDGLCMIARRTVAEEIGFDEATFDGFHLYDLDFSFSAFQAGKKLGVMCDIPIIHASEGNYDKIHALYGRLFIEKHKDAIPIDAPKTDLHSPAGVGIVFADHHDLCEMWQEDHLRRVWVAFQQRHDEKLRAQRET